eukprot:symbB.v1.2.006903.t1/scaffold418.1/size208590/7
MTIKELEEKLEKESLLAKEKDEESEAKIKELEESWRKSLSWRRKKMKNQRPKSRSWRKSWRKSLCWPRNSKNKQRSQWRKSRSCKQRLMSNPPYKRLHSLKFIYFNGAWHGQSKDS